MSIHNKIINELNNIMYCLDYGIFKFEIDEVVIINSSSIGWWLRWLWQPIWWPWQIGLVRQQRCSWIPFQRPFLICLFTFEEWSENKNYICTKFAVCLNETSTRPFILSQYSLNVERRGGVIITRARCWFLAVGR